MLEKENAKNTKQGEVMERGTVEMWELWKKFNGTHTDLFMVFRWYRISFSVFSSSIIASSLASVHYYYVLTLGDGQPEISLFLPNFSKPYQIFVYTGFIELPITVTSI